MTGENGLKSFSPYAAQAQYKYEQGLEEYLQQAAENYRRGFEPQETFPATWYNTMINALTVQAQATKSLCDSMFAELSYMITSSGQTLSALDTHQLAEAVDALYALHIATATQLGGVKSSLAAWKVAVDEDTGIMSVNTVDGTTSVKGLVQLSDTEGDTSTDKAATANIAASERAARRSKDVNSVWTGVSTNTLTTKITSSDGTEHSDTASVVTSVSASLSDKVLTITVNGVSTTVDLSSLAGSVSFATYAQYLVPSSSDQETSKAVSVSATRCLNTAAISFN